MLDRLRQPMRRDERRAEIARLKALRDQALAEAPGHRWLGCGIAAAVMAVSFLLLMAFGLSPPAGAPLAFLVVGATFVASAWGFWRATVGEPRDLDAWDLSDRYPGEEGSARTIQSKIDKLRREAGPWG